MGIARSIARASITGSSGIATPEKWVEEWFKGGSATASGVHVNEETALEYGPFFAGVRVISEDIGSLPLPLYERLQPQGKRRATDHPLYTLLHDAPNELMGAMQFRETLQGHALTWGDGLAYIVRNGAGEATELWPLRPDRTTPKVTTGPGGKMQLVYDYDDQVNGIQARIPWYNVLHIHGLGFDGVRGYSVVHMARNSIGLGLATEYYGGAFFGNGSRPGGVLQLQGKLSDGARKRMKTDWENLHQGLDRSQRIAILEEGATWQQIGIPPEDAQFLETRKLQVTEAARWLRLPPHKIADLERATFSNIESQQIDYVSSALRSWLVRWEQAITVRLLLPSERRQYFAEHLVDGLLRGDTQTRYAAYAVARQWGWMSADDIREKENQNPIPDRKGQTYLQPLNMIPAMGPDEEQPGAEDDEGRSGRRLLKAHARVIRPRGTEGRKRIAEAFAPLLVDADHRLAKLERAEVGRLVRRHLEGDNVSVTVFLDALWSLYDETVRAKTADRWAPIMSSLTTEIAADAAADVGHEDEVDLSRWVSAYVATHTAYRVNSAFGQLRKQAESAAENEAAGAVLGRLDKWVDERPDKTAKWHTNQLPNAAARETYKVAGVRRLRWVTFGDNCPFCKAMDGVVVGIAEPFVTEGAEVGLGETLQVDRETFHPPLHPGCDCDIAPE